jgi:DNA-directed RNA polymerase subunit RPC12/RpoP
MFSSKVVLRLNKEISGKNAIYKFIEMSKKNVFCYYCDASFDDENQLISHQKTKHFRCPECNRVKMNMKSLRQHMTEVHKSYLSAIPNAKEGRQDPEANVFGLSGIPEDVYVSWLATIDPSFKDSVKNVNMAGSFLATRAVLDDALQSSEKSHTLIRDQLYQFQKAKIQVAPSVNKVITAKGVVSSETLMRNVSAPLQERLANAQRLMERSRRRAEQILFDAERRGEKDLKQKTKERRAKEELYFTPDSEGRSVFEIRALQFAGI